MFNPITGWLKAKEEFVEVLSRCGPIHVITPDVVTDAVKRHFYIHRTL